MKINSQNVETNLKRTSRLGVLTVSRAHKLMAYGVNASSSKDADYNLMGFIRYEDDLEPLQDDFRLSFQEMFRSWTVGNGLRDMLEGVALALDGIYSMLTYVDGGLAGQKEKALNKKIKPYTKRGVKEKLSELRRDFGIEIDTGEHIETIVQARNCLTHRFGVVGEIDCDDGEKHLTLTWRSIDLTAIKSHGEETPITRDTPDSKASKGAQTLRCGTKTETLKFNLQEEVVIPPRVLEEMSVMLRFSIASLHALALNHLLDMGVPVNGGVRAELPTLSLDVEYKSSPTS